MCKRMACFFACSKFQLPYLRTCSWKILFISFYEQFNLVIVTYGCEFQVWPPTIIVSPLNEIAAWPCLPWCKSPTRDHELWYFAIEAYIGFHDNASILLSDEGCYRAGIIWNLHLGRLLHRRRWQKQLSLRTQLHNSEYWKVFRGAILENIRKKLTSLNLKTDSQDLVPIENLRDP